MFLLDVFRDFKWCSVIELLLFPLMPLFDGTEIPDWTAPDLRLVTNEVFAGMTDPGFALPI